MFQGFPEIKEALISDRMQVGFMVAPMAIALAAQGVPIKIVYLGHRYGSAVVVRKDGPIHSVKDLAGKTIAIPSRFSDERLIVFKALKQNGMTGSGRAHGRDGPARRRRRARRGRDRRLLDGRAVPVAGRARRLRPRPLPRPRVLARLHVLRRRRAPGRHRPAPAGGPDPRGRHRALGPVARRRAARTASTRRISWRATTTARSRRSCATP